MQLRECVCWSAIGEVRCSALDCNWSMFCSAFRIAMERVLGV